MQPVVGVDALDTMRRVDVLDKGDLVASRGSLAGDDGRRSEEVLPDLMFVSTTRHTYKTLKINDKG